MKTPAVPPRGRPDGTKTGRTMHRGRTRREAAGCPYCARAPGSNRACAGAEGRKRTRYHRNNAATLARVDPDPGVPIENRQKLPDNHDDIIVAHAGTANGSNTMRFAFAAVAAMICAAAAAAPRIPASDAEVLEHLPIKTSDPRQRELRQLRQAVASDPSNPDPALRLAERYFEIASAEGDPRYIGYAE